MSLTSLPGSTVPGVPIGFHSSFTGTKAGLSLEKGTGNPPPTMGLRTKGGEDREREKGHVILTWLLRLPAYSCVWQETERG